MTEISGKNKQIEFDFRNKIINANRSDFTDKEDLIIFDLLTKDNKQYGFNKKEISTKSLFGYRSSTNLDSGNKPKIITEEEIIKFTEQEWVKKKKVTKDNLTEFLAKLDEMSPTMDEIKIKKFQQKEIMNENGQNIITDEVKKLFTAEKQTISLNDITDSNNNIKKGLEIFDLNNDGKLEKAEKAYFATEGNTQKAAEDFYMEHVNNLNLDDFINILDKLSNKNTKPITPEIKTQIYNEIKEYKNQKLERKKKENLEELNSNMITNEKGKKIVTSEIKNLFSETKTHANISDIINNDGTIKNGMELFDLNDDGKLDQKEKNYFTNGGTLVNEGNEEIKLEHFLNILKKLDSFSTAANDSRDLKLYTQDKHRLYAVLGGAYYMQENMQNLSEESKEKYIDAMRKMTLIGNTKGLVGGTQSENKIGLSRNSVTTKDEIALVLIHELTHYIASNMSQEKINNMVQEVQCFYMEYKLAENLKNMEEGESAFSAVRSFQNYHKVIEDLKKTYPDMSEKELAITAFMKLEFNTYSENYNMKDPKLITEGKFYKIDDIFEDKIQN